MERVTIEGKEYGKIPFDLERWQSGDFVKVVTRDGNKDVENLTHFKSVTLYRNLYGAVNGMVHDFILDGKNDGKFNYGSEGTIDLHLIIEIPNVKQYFQNVYGESTPPYGITSFGCIEESKKQCDINVADVVNKQNRIGYMKVTIAEGEKPKYEFIPINQSIKSK